MLVNTALSTHDWEAAIVCQLFNTGIKNKLFFKKKSNQNVN